MTKRVLSFTKGGGIYVPPCNVSRPLFPSDVEPSVWPSCNDAGEYTWSMPQEDLSAITSTDRLKLSRSMGFCPHDRCQLGNLTNARVDGQCPQNLCYTKLENGGRSYGACCFIENKFNSGQLIGYYDKTQHAPKPIYKRSRVILGDEIGGADESYASFINANQIHPSIIATQCPLYNTVEDVLRMLVEQNISLWIQLAPFVDNTSSSHVSQCKMSQEMFAQTSTALNSSYVRINNIQKKARVQYGLTQATFSVDTFEVEYTKLSSAGHSNHHSNHHSNIDKHQGYEVYDNALPTTQPIDVIDNSAISSDSSKVRDGVVRSTQHVTNVWYNNWRDFDVPAPADEQDLMTVVDLAVGTIHAGGRVAVSCLSGRGRSGTFSALVIGKLQSVTSHSQLVDVVVGMREHRDGMLETPKQLRFVARMLALPSTAECGVLCTASHSLATHESLRLLVALLTGALLVLVPVFILLRKRI